MLRVPVSIPSPSLSNGLSIRELFRHRFKTYQNELMAMGYAAADFIQNHESFGEWKGNIPHTRVKSEYDIFLTVPAQLG